MGATNSQRAIGAAQVVGGLLDMYYGSGAGGTGGGLWLIGSGAKNLAASPSGTAAAGQRNKGFVTDLLGSLGAQGASYGLGQLGGLGGGSGSLGALGNIGSILGGGGSTGSSTPPVPPPIVNQPGPAPQPPPDPTQQGQASINGLTLQQLAMLLGGSATA